MQPPPIFVLAAGWCSGSIAVQHFLSREALLWGEPFACSNLLGWFCLPSAIERDSEKILSPIRRSLETLFDQPAKDRGFSRWGLSEVRANGRHVNGIIHLFPDAKIIFLLRNPYLAYSEYFAHRQLWRARSNANLTLKVFAQQWRIGATDFTALSNLSNCLLVRYEDLNSNNTWDNISTHLACENLAPNQMFDFPVPPELPDQYGNALEFLIGDTATELGYERPFKEHNKPMFSADTGVVLGQKQNSPSKTCTSANVGKTLITIRVRGHINEVAEAALRELEYRGYTIDRVGAFSAVETERSFLATRALADGYDNIVWIDSRLVFHPDAVEALLNTDLPIVGGLVPRDDGLGFECGFHSSTNQIQVGERAEMIFANSISFRFALTRRSAFSSIQLKHKLCVCNSGMGNGIGVVPYFIPQILGEDSKVFPTEDEWFCWLARQAGLPVVLLPSIRLGNMVWQPRTWEDAYKNKSEYDSFATIGDIQNLQAFPDTP
jgi:hypothetical protein